VTPKELREMSTSTRNSQPSILTAKGLYGALPWLVVIDHKVEEGKPRLRTTVLVWAQDDINALKLAGAQARGTIRSVNVVDPSQNINAKRVALAVTLPLDERNLDG